MQKWIDESGKHDFDDPSARRFLRIAEDYGAGTPLAFQQSRRCQLVQGFVNRFDVDPVFSRQFGGGRQQIAAFSGHDAFFEFLLQERLTAVFHDSRHLCLLYL